MSSLSPKLTILSISAAFILIASIAPTVKPVQSQPQQQPYISTEDVLNDLFPNYEQELQQGSEAAEYFNKQFEEQSRQLHQAPTDGDTLMNPSPQTNLGQQQQQLSPSQSLQPPSQKGGQIYPNPQLGQQQPLGLPQQQQSPMTDTPPPKLKISWELREAANLPKVPHETCDASPEELAVLAWLRKYESLIIAAEKKWKIDRRAIAGAIAWEALFNVKDQPGILNRWSGPGKVHYKNFVYGDTVAAEVEKAGYLPIKTDGERREILSTPAGSIDYIGAIMKGFADVVARSGYDIRNQPEMLGNFYHGWTLEKLISHFANKKYPARISIGDDEMGNWIKDNLSFLQDAVGKQFSSTVPSHKDKCNEKPRGGFYLRNVGTVVHTLTSGSPETGSDGLFDTGVVAPGQVVRLLVPPAGPAYCTIHPFEQGRGAYRNFASEALPPPENFPDIPGLG